MVLSNEGRQLKPAQWGAVAQGFLNYSEITSAKTIFEEINFGLGLSYETFFKRRPERMSVYNELKYKQVAQTGESVITTNFVVNSARHKIWRLFKHFYGPPPSDNKSLYAPERHR